MNKQRKQNINLFVPLVAASVTGIVSYRQKKDWKFILAIAAVVFVIVWVSTRRIVNMIEEAKNSPDKVNVDPDAAGTLDQNFDPTPYTNRLRADIYSLLGYLSRDKSLYADLVKLSNANLVRVYNDWNERYYHEHKETLVQAMADESYGNWNETAHNARNIIERLKGMGLQ